MSEKLKKLKKLKEYHLKFYNDASKAGTRENPAIWLLGVEPGGGGTGKNNKDNNNGVIEEGAKNYTVEYQRKMGWPYNQNAFKLFAAMDPVYGLDQWEKFADKKGVFEVGRNSGFFNGNLYPVSCKTVKTWGDAQKEETGFDNKKDYQDWCHDELFRGLRDAMEKRRPSLIIANGIGQHRDFVKAIFDEAISVKQGAYERIEDKPIFIYQSGWKKLVVIHHISSSYGNSNNYFTGLGKRLRELITEA